MEQTWITNSFTARVTFALVFLSPVFHSNAHLWRRQVTDDPPGTTPNIEAIFKGRCHEHLQCLQTDRCYKPGKTVDCEDTWKQFLKVFQYVQPCNTSADAYDEVLKTIAPITPEDQTLFWSGLLDAALNVARVSEHFRILEESLPGYIANNLNWCGDPDRNSSGGINYTTCPSSYDCDGETGFAFWQAASREFSKQATGKVSVALNAHREGGAFRNKSVFATVELPNIDPKKVNMVDILLVPDIKLPINKSEKCDEGSILVLQSLIEERGMKWTCIFDPVEFRFIQCTTLDDPLEYEACVGGSPKKKCPNLAVWILIGAGGGILLLIVILAIIIFARKHRRGSPPYSRQESEPV